jgi:hypothetical protein
MHSPRIDYATAFRLVRGGRVKKSFTRHAVSTLLFCTSVEEAAKNLGQLRANRPEWFGFR